VSLLTNQGGALKERFPAFLFSMGQWGGFSQGHSHPIQPVGGTKKFQVGPKVKHRHKSAEEEKA